jgi:mannose/fructose-specific phosphotransferase system component IIA
MTSLRPHVTATPSGGGMVLLDTRSGKYWQLNETGALILSDLLEGASPAETAAHLAEQHPTAAERASRDIDALLQQLATAQLIS